MLSSDSKGEDMKYGADPDLTQKVFILLLKSIFFLVYVFSFSLIFLSGSSSIG